MIPFGADGFRNFKRCRSPADIGTRRGNFFVTERGAVRIGRALLVGCALADHRLAANQARPIGNRLRFRQCGVERGELVPVNIRLHMPAVGFETLRRIVGKPALHFAVDRNAVIVVERDQLAEPKGTGKRTGFVRNAFHQTTIAKKYISAMVNNGVPRPVEFGGEQFFRQRHADRIGDALTQRAGGGFDTGCDAVFGMPCGLRMQLAETLQFFDRQIIAG